MNGEVEGWKGGRVEGKGERRRGLGLGFRVTVLVFLTKASRPSHSCTVSAPNCQNRSVMA